MWLNVVLIGEKGVGQFKMADYITSIWCIIMYGVKFAANYHNLYKISKKFEDSSVLLFILSPII